MKKSLLIPCLLVTLPLLESLFLGNSLGLEWQSPQLMYLVSAYLIPVKLLMVLSGLVLLSKVDAPVKFNYLRTLVVIAGTIHGVILAMVCIVYLASGIDEWPGRENGNIYVYTADAGGMGKSYHYFSYICRDNYGFYTLHPIAKLDWLGEFSFHQQEHLLIIEHTDYDGEHEKQLDLTAFSCE